MAKTQAARNFWKDKRVFLTGHTGFIGGWTALWLSHLGAKVYGFSLPPHTEPNFFGATGLAKDIDHGLGDIRNLDAVQKAIDRADPEIVLHLAAQALVRPAFKDPVTNFTSNVTGTLNILEAARSAPSLQSILVFTTDKVYENTDSGRPFVESDRLGGHEPYGASKACCEIVCASYWHSYFKPKNIPLAALRAGNVIGGGDWSQDRLLPDAMRAFDRGETLTIRSPEAVRPWQHVLEPCLAILMAVENMGGKSTAALNSFNIGPMAEDARTVGQIADLAAAHWRKSTGQPAQWRHQPGDGIYEAKLLTLDNSKARRDLGWQPLWDVDQAMRHTVEWYAAYRQQKDMKEFSLQQIENFSAPQLKQALA